MAVQSGSERLRPWRFLLCAGRDSEVRVCGDFVSSSTTSAWDLSTETLAATRKEERRAAGPLRAARPGSGRARVGMLFSRSVVARAATDESEALALSAPMEGPLAISRGLGWCLARVFLPSVRPISEETKGCLLIMSSPSSR
jgi:hypothetical protein